MRICPWTLFPGITELKRITLCMCAHVHVYACVWWWWRNNTRSVKNFDVHFLHFYLSLRCFLSVFCSRRVINLDCGYGKCSHISFLSSSVFSHITWLTPDISLSLLFFSCISVWQELDLNIEYIFTNSLKKPAKLYFNSSLLAVLCVPCGNPHSMHSFFLLYQHFLWVMWYH